MIIRHDLISSYVRERCKINAAIKVLVFPFDVDLNISSRMCVCIYSLKSSLKYAIIILIKQHTKI